MHILYVTACGEGGIAYYIKMLAQHLNHAGVKVTIIGPKNSYFAESIQDIPGVHFIGLPIRKRIAPLSDFYCLFKLWCIFRDGNYEVIHSNSSKAGFLDALARTQSKGSIFVYSPHCTVANASALGILRWPLAALERWAARRHDLVIACCKTEQSDVLKSGVGNVETIYHGVEAPSPKSSNNVHPIIGTIARLVPQKGVDYLIRAMKDILKSFPNARLVIAGDGSMEQELRSLTCRECVDEQVEFLGYIKDCYSFLAGLDVFVLPSRWEALSLAILQAGYARIPVVATDVGGTHEVINSTTGWLVSPGDVVTLSSVIIQCLTQKEEAVKRAERLRDLVVDRHNVDRMVRDTYTTYCQIAGIDPEGQLPQAKKIMSAATAD